jgi:hypothetical protein
MEPFNTGFFHLVIWVYIYSMCFPVLIAHLVLNNVSLSGHITVGLCTPPSEGYFVCFWVQIILSQDVINICVNKSFISFWKIPRSMIVELYSRFMYDFVRNCFARLRHHFTFPSAMDDSSYHSPSLPGFGVVHVLDFIHSNKNLLVSSFVFICIS